MSVYTVPALNSVNFALTAFTPDPHTPYEMGLTSYTVPALSAVDFALAAYTAPDFSNIGWELLPGGGGFPTQFFGLRTYYHSAVQDLCLVAAADAATGMGGAPMVNKNGTTYAIYLVETTDPDASPVRISTSAGVKSVRLKT